MCVCVRVCVQAGVVPGASAGDGLADLQLEGVDLQLEGVDVVVGAQQPPPPPPQGNGEPGPDHSTVVVGQDFGGSSADQVCKPKEPCSRWKRDL